MTRTLLATLMLAALGPVAAQSIDAITPDAGAFGTALTIAGTGFGTTKPKVLVVSQDDGKARKLKVLEWSDTQIVAELRKLPAGLHDVQVVPKGKGLEPLAAPAPLTVQLPSDPLFTPGRAGPGDEVTLTAHGLGTKKGVVKVGGAKAKVLSWDAGAGAEGEGLGTVLFKLGKKTPAGPQPVSVTTTAGTAVFQDGLDVLEGDGGGGGGGGGIPGNPFDGLHPGLSCDFDGVAVGPWSPPPYAPWSGGTTNLKVTGSKDAGFTTLALYFQYEALASPDKTKTLQLPQAHLVYTTLSSVYATTLNPFTGEAIPGASATITYTGIEVVGSPPFTKTTFGGAFSGTLALVLGSGPPTLTISNGFFWTY